MEVLQNFGAARSILTNAGIYHRGTTMVLYAMLEDGLDYWEAVREWAAYEFEGAWPWERWNASICYGLMAAGIDEHPAVWLGDIVRRVKDADRVSAEQGS